MPAWDVRFDLPLDLGDADLIRALARAEALAEVIQGIPVSPFVETALNRLNILRAVRANTALEGADLSEDEVRLVLDSSSQVLASTRGREEQETRNADEAMRYVAGLLSDEPDRPIDEETICRINELLTQKIEYADHEPGHYRAHGVTAQTYVPPRTHEQVVSLMGEFVSWLNHGKVLSWPPVARAVAAHFYLVSIHPFGDGNGRTARAVESYLLYQSRINSFGFYSLANFYYRNRDTYIAKLDEVRFTTQNLMTFVRFAVDGLVEELSAVHREVLAYVEILAYRDFSNETLQRSKLSTKNRERLSKLLTMLEGRPASLREIRTGGHRISALYKGASIRMVERDLDQLEKLRLIRREAGLLQARLEVLKEAARITER